MVFYAAGEQVASSLPSGIQIRFDFVMDSVCTENKYLESDDTSSVARRKKDFFQWWQGRKYLFNRSTLYPTSFGSSADMNGTLLQN